MTNFLFGGLADDTFRLSCGFHFVPFSVAGVWGLDVLRRDGAGRKQFQQLV